MMTIKFDAITFDTQLVRTNDFRFENTPLDLLSEIAESGLPILVSEVVIGELINQLTEKVQKLKSRLQNDLDEGDKFNLLKEGHCAGLSDLTAKKAAFDYLLKVFKSLKIDMVRNAEADLGEIWERYQNGQPPFGVKNKKSEFPDGIALNALEKFAEKKDWSILAISGDDDWLSYGAESNRITVVNDISSALKKLASSQSQFLASKVATFITSLIDGENAKQLEFLEERLATELEGYSFPADAESEWGFEGEAHLKEIVEISINEGFVAASVNILEVQKGVVKALAIIPIAVNFTGFFDFFTIDSEGDELPRGQTSATTSGILEQELILTIKLDQVTSKLEKLLNVEIVPSTDEHAVHFGYLEPEQERQDEIDWDQLVNNLFEKDNEEIEF